MSSIYGNDGHSLKDHVHYLERISEPPYRYRCLTCNAQLEKLSGILRKLTPPPPSDSPRPESPTT